MQKLQPLENYQFHNIQKRETGQNNIEILHRNSQDAGLYITLVGLGRIPESRIVPESYSIDLLSMIFHTIVLSLHFPE